ncbi:MAG TPA: molybdenum cofactor biosynthesis protein B [Candidatus Binataceae bacterium]|nr:molybdenum cofactor biosynthesis protein B [Candidatus Binataceae bacterium]
MPAHEHKQHARANLNVGIVSASDTRTLETDKSGLLVRQMLEAAGHRVGFHQVVPDDRDRIASVISTNLGGLDAMIITGGTGIAPRDCTIEALTPLLDKEMPGFGELFRTLSYEEIGSAAFLSRAMAGISAGKFVAALPGSTAGCRLAMEKLIIPELGHIAFLLQS